MARDRTTGTTNRPGRVPPPAFLKKPPPAKAPTPAPDTRDASAAARDRNVARGAAPSGGVGRAGTAKVVPAAQVAAKNPTGAHVAALQQSLVDQGFGLEVDGIWGPKSKAAWEKAAAAINGAASKSLKARAEKILQHPERAKAEEMLAVFGFEGASRIVEAVKLRDSLRRNQDTGIRAEAIDPKIDVEARAEARLTGISLPPKMERRTIDNPALDNPSEAKALRDAQGAQFERELAQELADVTKISAPLRGVAAAGKYLLVGPDLTNAVQGLPHSSVGLALDIAMMPLAVVGKPLRAARVGAQVAKVASQGVHDLSALRSVARALYAGPSIKEMGRLPTVAEAVDAQIVREFIKSKALSPPHRVALTELARAEHSYFRAEAEARGLDAAAKEKLLEPLKDARAEAQARELYARVRAEAEWAPIGKDDPRFAARAALAKKLYAEFKGKRGALPEEHTSAAKMRDALTFLDEMAEKGIRGRMWYETSAKAITEMAQGDVVKAERFAQLLAIYSPQQTIIGNTGLAVRAWNEFLAAAADVEAGTAVSVGQTWQRAAAEKVMLGQGDWEGRKTNTFYVNFLEDINPEKFKQMVEAGDIPADGVTADMWMARVFGYHKDEVAKRRYDVISAMTDHLAAERGWKPKQVQAAIWTAIKDASNDSSANIDFSEGISRHVGQFNYEAAPGNEIPEAAGFAREYATWPAETQERFMEASALLVDSFLREVGLLRRPSRLGAGVYETAEGIEFNPGAAAQFLTSGAPAATYRVHEAERSLIESAAAAIGDALKQNSVAWIRPWVARSPGHADTVVAKIGRAVTGDEAREITASLNRHGGDGFWAVMNAPDGLIVRNFTDIPNVSRTDFNAHTLVKKALDDALPDAQIGVTYHAADGDLVEWGAYADHLREAGDARGSGGDLRFGDAALRLSRESAELRVRYVAAARAAAGTDAARGVAASVEEATARLETLDKFIGKHVDEVNKYLRQAAPSRTQSGKNMRPRRTQRHGVDRAQHVDVGGGEFVEEDFKAIRAQHGPTRTRQRAYESIYRIASKSDDPRLKRVAAAMDEADSLRVMIANHNARVFDPTPPIFGATPDDVSAERLAAIDDFLEPYIGSVANVDRHHAIQIVEMAARDANTPEAERILAALEQRRAIADAMLPPPKGEEQALADAEAWTAGIRAEIEKKAADETGSLTPGAFLPDRPGLDTSYEGRTLKAGELPVQIPQARSRLTQAGERLVDRASKALDNTRVRDIRGLRIATAHERAVKYAGRRQRLESPRRLAAQMPHLDEIAKVKEGSDEDVAHFWWAQLPESLRNGEGLVKVRRGQEEELDYITSGRALEDIDAREAGVRAEMADAETSGEALRHLNELEQIKLLRTDLPERVKDISASVAELDRLAAQPPQLNVRLIEALRAIAADRTQILVDSGRLNADRARNRESILSQWLEVDADGTEIYMGHRLPRPDRTGMVSVSSGGTGRVSSPRGVGSYNRLTLAATGRLRASVRVAAEDWQAAQVFAQANEARADLAAMGKAFTGNVPEDHVLVNPKGRTIPPHWRTDELSQFHEDANDIAELRIRAKEVVDEFVADDPIAFEEMKRKALEDGVQWDELRVVPRRDVERYYAQFRSFKGRTTKGVAYDMMIDGVATSIIFARVGYIPKNVVQNFIMAIPHQGVFLPINIARAGQVFADEELTRLIRAEVGFTGASGALSTEAASKKVLGAVAGFVGSLADDPARMTAFLHEAAAAGVIGRHNILLTEKDKKALVSLFTDKKHRRLLNDIRSRSVDAMADFSRLTPDQARTARRLLIIPGWLAAGSRYPFHFAATHPIRFALIGYVALGEPGAPDELHFNEPAWDYIHGSRWLAGIDTPWGRLRTASLNPVSTPWELASAAVTSIRGKTSPFARDEPTVFDYAQPAISAGIGILSGQGVGKQLKRLAPNYSFLKGMVRPAPSASYPEDATRLGRLKREIGILPIDVVDEKPRRVKTKKTARPGSGGIGPPTSSRPRSTAKRPF